MVRLELLLTFTILASNAGAHEVPTLEMLLFVADCTDSDGNWNAPPVDDTSDDRPDHEGDSDD